MRALSDGWRLALIGLALLLTAGCGGNGNEDVTPEADTPTASDPVVIAIRSLSVPAGLADGSALGRPDAEVILEIFEDFQCPFCLTFTAAREGFLLSEYVEPGIVRLEFRHFPFLGDESVAAAVGAYCAGEQNHFWEFQAALFLLQANAGQHEAEELDVGRFSDDALVAIAANLGLDAPQWSACFDSAEALAAIEADRAAARAAGIRGTPGFIINGSALPSAPGSEEAWRHVIDAARSD